MGIFIIIKVLQKDLLRLVSQHKQAFHLPPSFTKLPRECLYSVPDVGWQRFAPATFNNPQITKSSPRQ